MFAPACIPLTCITPLGDAVGKPDDMGECCTIKHIPADRLGVDLKPPADLAAITTPSDYSAAIALRTPIPNILENIINFLLRQPFAEGAWFLLRGHREQRCRRG